MTSPHVLIIGAGLAGPAMALALARQSIRSTIYERRATSQDIGGVLTLAANAIRVLDQIVGVEGDIRKLGYSFSGIEMHASPGASPLEKLGQLGVDTKTKGVSIKRPVLHAKLLELCEEEKLIAVEFDKRLTEIDEREDGVTAIFEDGSRADGDILIGVDGIYSRVRQHILGGAGKAEPYSPKYTDHVVLGSTISCSALDLTGISPPAFFYTQSGTILTFPTDPSGETLQWAAFFMAEERDRKDWDEYRTSGQAIADLREEWKSVTTEPIRALLESLTTENLLLWAPYAIPDLPTWHTNRVVLVGDAAHAISPSAGQGTAQALEDVGLLSRLLGSPAAMQKGYPAIFKHYEKYRKQRLDGVRKMVERSIASRAPTPSWSSWWIKKMGFKAMLTVMSGLRGVLPANNAMAYDVTKETIDIQA